MDPVHKTTLPLFLDHPFSVLKLRALPPTITLPNPLGRHPLRVTSILGQMGSVLQQGSRVVSGPCVIHESCRNNMLTYLLFTPDPLSHPSSTLLRPQSEVRPVPLQSGSVCQSPTPCLNVSSPVSQFLQTYLSEIEQ